MTSLSPWQALLQQLQLLAFIPEQQQRSSTLLYCSDRLPVALEDWCREHQCQLTHIQTSEQLDHLGRFDCAVVSDWLEHHPPATGIQFLARLRNLHTHSIWVLLSREFDPQPHEGLLGLGFKRQNQFLPSAQLDETSNGLMQESYGYNLDQYNRKREWNSPKFWANPENWGKYWW